MINREMNAVFLYSQDLSNCTTKSLWKRLKELFLYSQDLSNCTTLLKVVRLGIGFCTLKI